MTSGSTAFRISGNDRDLAITPDGRRVVYVGNNGSQLFVRALNQLESTPLVVSPDGRWLAYQSDESGRLDVYVRPFPKVDTGRWQVSSGGGMQPVWARTGRELFYRTTSEMMRVAVEPGQAWVAGSPTLLFKGSYFDGGGAAAARSYDVSPDGQRFLMIKQGGSEQNDAAPALIVVQNWTEELKRLVPSN